MVYEFEFYTNRPSFYLRDYLRPRYYPSYYSSYLPSYGSYLHDRYYYTNGYYKPWYRSPYTYARTRDYMPYRPNYDYKYDIPENTYRHYTPYPMSRLVTPIYPEAEKYAHTYGLKLDAATRDIRSKSVRLLQECRSTVQRASSIPRFVRASSLEPTYSSDDDYYRMKRAVSRTRMMSEEPSFYSSQFY
ncbi:uncharacterized protein LOC119073653 isoform X1 [Bradysia coprophila]|uniref:uncharacterized protein LOC119073653 isoform X1 n=1 Tax=Bradysia coprophila TaxID=38358 RepID=UPI00187DC759|nr:uncharacterized protein LOC119073653 isoform X1 [Bradysia coprophila]